MKSLDPDAARVVPLPRHHRALPLAPLALTLLIVAAGAGYWLWRAPHDPLGGLPAPRSDALRVATWDLRADPPGSARIADDAIRALAASLAGVRAQVIALQGAADRQQVEHVAAALGPTWTCEAVPAHADGSGPWLAILADTRAGPIVKSLVQPTSDTQALAFEISGPTVTVLLICMQFDAGSDLTRGYVDGILGWCARRAPRTGRVTILAAPFSADPPPPDALLTQFQVIQSRGTLASKSGGALYVSPRTAKLMRASTMHGHNAAPPAPIVVVDVQR
ncbi:MAG TPA: hypothetical protein VGM03_15190 [Phycisphaerae bacterium]|jgi:hypothetical protein